MTARLKNLQLGSWLVAILIGCQLINVIAWHFKSFLNPYILLLIWLGALGYCAYHIKALWPILLIAPVFIIILLGQPLSAWDARSIWFFHAKRIFFDGTATAQLDDYASWSHNDYPILVPAMAASFGRLLGHWNEIFPKLAIFSTTAPIFLLMGIVLNRPTIWALWFTAILLIAGPELSNGYVDALLALYFGASLIIATRIQSPGHPSALLVVETVLLTLLTANLLLIKNEGLPALALISLLAFIGPHGKNILAACALAFIIYLLTWKIHVWNAHIQTDLLIQNPAQKFIDRIQDLNSIQIILGQFFRHSGIILLGGLAFMSTLRRQLYLQGALIAIFGYALIIFVVYLMTPYDLNWHLTTSASRILSGINITMATYLTYALTRIPQPYLTR